MQLWGLGPGQSKLADTNAPSWIDGASYTTFFLHYVLVPQLIINLPIAEGSKHWGSSSWMASKQENGGGVYGPAPSKRAADLCRRARSWNCDAETNALPMVFLGKLM